MRQPVSRISFDRRRGFLGVHLQEGALFVDAAWNEGADIAWSLLRDAILAGGLEGTSGRELRIDPVRDQTGRLINLQVCGTGPSLPPRPFYCDGLPVLWPADLAIDAQLIGDAFRIDATENTHVPAGGSWIDLLEHLTYEIFLRARVETLDRLDDPFLDDPGLDAPRGTFRKRVVSEVRIRQADATRRRRATNLRLSVDGSYRSDLNVLYRVELDSLTGSTDAPAASVLWDPDAAATIARVVDTALEGARQVMVDTTQGFDNGFVRFEGPGIGPVLYRVTKAPGLEGAAIQVTRHRCDRAEVSLAAWQPAGLPERLSHDRFSAAFLVPAPVPVQAGDILCSLPEALRLSWGEAKVVAVAAFDADHNTVTLTLQQAARDEASPRALSLADWRAEGPAVQNTDGTFTAVLVPPPAIVEGDVVTALPPTLGNRSTSPWVALEIARIPAPSQAAPPATPARSQLKITFGPAGLAQQLSTLDTDHKATLRAPAHPFDTTLTVDEHSEWTVGMRISILGKRADSNAVREDRTIVRIERSAGELAAGARRRMSAPGTRTMLVRLDQPLSYDHAADDEEVIPERLIRVRRFAGHQCRLGIDVVDPVHHGAASIANFSPALTLPDGLALHLTVEKADGPPWLERGDGWHFAARSDGFVETRLFAPVEEQPMSEVPLAQLTITAQDHQPTITAQDHELIDLRPLPAALSVDDELARIGSAGFTIAELLGDDPAAQAAKDVASLSRYARVQPRLVQRLRELAQTDRSRLHASPVCRPWLERLDRAVSEIGAGDEPTRRQVAAIGFAITGLAFAFSTEHPAPSAPASPPPPPSTWPGTPPPTTTPAAASPPAVQSTPPPTRPPAETSAPPPAQPPRPRPGTLPPPPLVPPARRPAPATSPPPPSSGPGAKAEHKHGFLDKAEAVLAKVEDELKTAASVVVAGLEAAAEITQAAEAITPTTPAKPSARADEPKPPARPDPKKP